MRDFIINKLFKKYLPILLAVFLFVFIIYFLTSLFNSTKKVEAGWYASGGTWTHRKPVTIDRNKVATSTSLSNFPMVFSVIDSDLKYTSFGGKVASSTGGDLVFTSDDGTTKLSYEVEKYASTTGETIMWVKIPTLSGTVNTTIYLYFGNASASNNQDPNGVWDSNYKGVYHLPNGTSLSAKDSTSNAFNGTVNSATAVSGQIDGGVNMNGSSQYVGMGNVMDIGTGDVTVEAWINPPNTNSYMNLISKRASSGTFAQYNMGQGYNDSSGGANNSKQIYIAFFKQLPVNSTNAQFYHTTNDVVDGYWHHIMAGRDSNGVFIYVDGVDQTLTADVANTTPVDTTNTSAFNIGYDNNVTYAISLMDEVRMSNIKRSVYWAKTQYNNQSSPNTFYSYGALGVQNRSATSSGVGITSTSTALSSWYATGGTWTNRKRISINHNQVATSTSLSNFPMVFSVIDSDLKYTSFGGKVASSTGADILFTLADGTKLSHEIEKYASTTGELVAWVKIPTLSPTIDTDLYIYFGNASVATDQQDRTNVWDSNYKGVWHLNSTSTTTFLLDSTSNANSAIKLSNTEPNAITSKIGGGQVFDGVNDYTQISDAASLDVSATNTWSAWIKINNFPGAGAQYLAQLYSDENTNIGTTALWRIGSQGNSIYQKRIGINFNDGVSHDTQNNTDLVAGYWTYITVTTDGSNAKFYLDGVLDTTVSYTITPTQKSRNWFMGLTVDGLRPFDGTMDEMRFTNSVARNAGWIKTEYNNQSNPSAFYGYGGLESQSRVSGSTSLPAVKARGGVKFR